MRVLAVVAHPDDELMCAGTLARSGHAHIKIMFDRERRSAFEPADCARKLGATVDHCLNPNEDSYRVSVDAVAEMDEWVRWSRPDVVISHRPDDTNQTHATLAKVVRAACRKNAVTLWQMDQAIPGGWDSTSPRPNHLVNITGQVAAKAEAVAAYASQLDRYPDMAEAIDARDRYYGWMLAQGDLSITHAEGFIVEKSVWL